jgi:hypothetical protein
MTTPFLNVADEVGEGGGIGLLIEAFREFDKAGCRSGCIFELFPGA